MSKKVKYPNGHIGTASDKVSEILIKKGSATLVGDAPKTQSKPAKPDGGAKE